ncbi:MAG: DUF1838 family protein [Pseudomonadota bacterium]
MRLKHLLLPLLGVAVLAGPVMAASKKLDPGNPNDAITLNRKIHCSAKDGEEVVYHWQGRAYSRRQGERDTLLFNLQGMNVRQCVTVRDKERGTGYKMVSREIMLYLDPKTNEILDTWENPFTGETVDVIHVANDPVNMRAPNFPKTRDGKDFSLPLRIKNGKVFMLAEVPLFYTNALGGDFQKYVGNQYHAMEIFDFIMEEDDILDAKSDIAYPTVAWVRIAQWLPWMEMGARPGLMIANAAGQKLGSIDELPQVLQDAIKTRFPKYASAPPTDDARPNETSWTVFKKKLSERMENEGKAANAGGH